VLAVIAIVLMAIGVSKIPAGQMIAPDQTNNTASSSPDGSDALTVYHSQQNGVQYYSGLLQLPTPCHALSASAVTANGDSKQIQLHIVVNQPAADQVCAQVVTPKDFTTSINATSDATVTADINGQQVPVNIVEQ
jgi:hypothetical protein